MDFAYSKFGTIVIDGIRFDHDVVVEGGRLRRRRKGPSKPYRDQFGHTPLSPDEDIPWTGSRLFVGTGASGRLPIMTEVLDAAESRGVEVIALPTAEACEVLRDVDRDDVYAILHVTC